MRYERTQSGNPHRLTINQHVFPKASIARFAQDDGLVAICLLEQQRTVRLPPQDPVFCARRAWNQTTEHGLMKQLEDAFQRVAKRVLERTTILPLNPSENGMVSQFYALVRLRADAKRKPQTDIKIKAVLPGETLSTNEEELLEKNGYIFTRGTSMPSRHMESIRIQVLLSRLCPPDTVWAPIYSRAIEFLVPDSFREIGIVPVSPQLCLVANSKGGEVLPANAISINRLAIDKASKYYFARDLSLFGI